MLACVSFLRFCPWKLVPPSSSPLPSLGRKLFCEAQAFNQRPVDRKMLIRQQRFDLRMVQKLGHELGEHLAVLQPVAVLGEHGRVPHRVVGRKSHEPAVQKIVVQLLHQLAFRPDAVEHLQQQGSTIAPAGSKDGLRSRKAAKGYGSALPTHRAQASGSFSADGSPAPAPQAKCTKTTDPDPKIPPACKPPPIRDRKTESANPRYGEGFFSKLLELGPHPARALRPHSSFYEFRSRACQSRHRRSLKLGSNRATDRIQLRRSAGVGGPAACASRAA